ncbi:MAG: hypothetical protein R2731_01145 [Nocardioides sp.]
MPRLPRSDWYDLTRDMNWHLSYVTDDEAFPEDLSHSHGIAPESWWSAGPEGPDAGARCYLAGPPVMVDATLQALRAAGVSLARTHYDRFG